MKNFIIEIASNEDGPAIGELAVECGFRVAGVDWTDIYPYWLVAKRGDLLIAAIQVLPGKPFARVELLFHRSDLEPLDRAKVIGAILEQALIVASMGGAKFVSGLIPFGMKHYKKVLKKRGGMIFEDGHILYMAV